MVKSQFQLPNGTVLWIFSELPCKYQIVGRYTLIELKSVFILPLYGNTLTQLMENSLALIAIKIIFLFSSTFDRFLCLDNNIIKKLSIMPLGQRFYQLVSK